MQLSLSHKRYLVLAVCAAFTLQNTLAENRSKTPADKIPKEWIEQQGDIVYEYAAFIDSIGLKKVTTKMVLAPHFKSRGRSSNNIPPKNLWENIVNTLKVVDELSTRLDAEVSPFISIYRSPQYNRAVRGKTRSYAVQNCAVRVRFKDIDSRTAAAAARALRSKGFFNGGVGRYESYIHIDTRGFKADW